MSVWACSAVKSGLNSTNLAHHVGDATKERYPQAPSEFISYIEDGKVIYGESHTSRTIYTVVSLVCISLLAGMLGHRARQLDRKSFRRLNFTRVVVLVLETLAMSFVFAAAVIESGLGLSSPPACHATIVICLAFYVGSKVAMYIFLVERAHAIRAPYMRRRNDWIWLLGMFTVACGFGSIAICGFLWPIADLSAHDGRCRIGLPYKVTIPLLSFDVIINTALTAIFIYLLRPLLLFSGIPSSAGATNWFPERVWRLLGRFGRQRSTNVYPVVNQHFMKSIETLLWKSFIGSILVMLPTVGNLAALYSLEGRELGWLCLTICTFDITWAVCVIHWLTIGSSDIDEQPLTMLVAPDSASNTSNSAPTF